MTRYSFLIFLFLTFLFLTVTTPARASNTTFFANVTVDLPDFNPGDGVCAAIRDVESCTLRAAIQESNASCLFGVTCEIILVDGLYQLTIDGGDDQAAKGDLDIKKCLIIRGEGPNKTIIDGSQINTRLFQLLGTPCSVRMTGVTLQYGTGERGGAILNEGWFLDIDDCKLSHNISTDYGGGAIFNRDGSLTIQDCTLIDNVAEGKYAIGGAIRNITANLFIKNSTINGNSSVGSLLSQGGGIYSLGNNVTIISSEIAHNVSNGGGSEDYGGGIYMDQGHLGIHESVIDDNYAKKSGGGILVVGGSLSLRQSRVTGNIADPFMGVGYGGGIYLIDYSAGIDEISDSEISGNTASVGGGLYRVGTEMLISGSTFSENYAHSHGGGIYNTDGVITLIQSTVNENRAFRGAGLFVDKTGHVNIVNSTISTNMALSDGGGIYNNDGSASLHNATVAANQANADNERGGVGGGIFSQAGNIDIHVVNSILADNVHLDDGSVSPDDCHGSLYFDGYNLIESDIDCNLGGDPTGVIIGQDPLLGPLQTNGGSTKTHFIPSNSPAVDAGNPYGCEDSYSQPLTEDQRGVDRHLDGDGDGEKRCDMGAYEYRIQTIP